LPRIVALSNTWYTDPPVLYPSITVSNTQLSADTKVHGDALLLLLPSGSLLLDAEHASEHPYAKLPTALVFSNSSHFPLILLVTSPNCRDRCCWYGSVRSSIIRIPFMLSFGPILPARRAASEGNACADGT
jgi:hypothetical protein